MSKITFIPFSKRADCAPEDLLLRRTVIKDALPIEQHRRRRPVFRPFRRRVRRHAGTIILVFMATVAFYVIGHVLFFLFDVWRYSGSR